MSSSRPHVAIVGAGISGLAAAILCAKLTVLTQDQATSRALALVALLLPAALLVFGHNQAGPIYALIAGSSVLFFGLSNAWDFGGAGAGWLCAAFAATAAWLTIGLLHTLRPLRVDNREVGHGRRRDVER